ncbi:alpha/beta hydrolase [Chitinophaga rhizosphaerae]|uniref:alpha/beta hydrolase n=1 Tax=Chitinophaga rhizosphaerae TaxID=1864947 RepID=UPI000F801391|nr:alpha/beta hydrolase [Chitinophaga rhizosphaerae]
MSILYKLHFVLALLVTASIAYAQERPQEPKPKYPYHVENTYFPNRKDSISLAGTFSRPFEPGKYPAVVLISGSGPQDRNSNILGHKSFLVIADYLTRNGIAVLRYDDRGVGESRGVMKGSGIAEFTRDAEAALEYLKGRADVDGSRIGVIGHSEGGAIGLVLAAENPAVKFLVSMAGPGVRGDELIMSQTKAILQQYQAGDSIVQQQLGYQRKMMDAILQEKDTAALRGRIRSNARAQYDDNPNIQKNMEEGMFIQQVSSQYLTPEYLSIVRFDPKPYFAKVTCPVLALNGDKDVQVISSIHLPGWKNGIKNADTREMPGLNHLFQTCKSCQVMEYARLTETISPAVLSEISDWIRLKTGLRK